MTKIIEKYILKEIIGSGQYGKVYKANLINQQNLTFAVKVLKLNKFKQIPKLHEFTMNEIQTLTKIQNPSIVKFIQMIRTNNNMCLVYQYCSGGTLQQLILKSRFLSEYEVHKIIFQLLSAFKILCKQNILHRDIKPSNILLHEGVIKIADFGFCKSVESQNQMTSTMVGSPIYMAPEVLKGYPYTSKADIWSLGVVIYECLFGRCPYEDKSIAKLISQIDNKDLVFPRNINNISKKLEDLIRQMLTIDQRKRPNWNMIFKAYDQNFSPSKQKNCNSLKQKTGSSKKQNNNLNSSKQILSENINLMNIPKTLSVSTKQNVLKRFIKERNKLNFLHKTIHYIVQETKDMMIAYIIIHILYQNIYGLYKRLLNSPHIEVIPLKQLLLNEEIQIRQCKEAYKNQLLKQNKRINESRSNEEFLCQQFKTIKKYILQSLKSKEVSQEKSRKKYLHCNDILDAFLLPQLFNNYVEGTQRNEEYEQTLKGSSISDLRKMIDHKLIYMIQKYRIEL